jgi:hypothetical protein
VVGMSIFVFHHSHVKNLSTKTLVEISTNRTILSVHTSICTYSIFQETQERKREFICKYNRTVTSMNLHDGTTFPTEGILFNPKFVLHGPQLNYGIKMLTHVRFEVFTA